MFSSRFCTGRMSWAAMCRYPAKADSPARVEIRKSRSTFSCSSMRKLRSKNWGRMMKFTPTSCSEAGRISWYTAWFRNSRSPVCSTRVWVPLMMWVVDPLHMYKSST